MGKTRKVNASLKAWVAFVKKVQKQYKLSYKDAIHKAKVLKDGGADWKNSSVKLKGGSHDGDDMEEMEVSSDTDGQLSGGRRRRRTRRSRRARRTRRSMGRGRSMGMVLGVA